MAERPVPHPHPDPPLEGEGEKHHRAKGRNSLPFKGKVAPATFAIGRAGEGMGKTDYLLLQERQHVLRQAVGLREHRRTGLLQNLRP